MCRNVRRAVGTLIAALAVVLACGVGADAAPRSTTLSRPLVLPFAVVVDGDVPGGDGAGFWLGEAAALLLSEELAARQVSVLTRAERVAAFGSLQLPMTASLTRATMIRVGELVGADELIVGEVRLGARMVVTVRVIGLEAARDQGHASAEGTATGLYDVMEAVAETLMPGRRHAIESRLPLSAFEQYVKGLVATTPAVQERFLEAARQQAPTDDRILLALWDFHSTQGTHDRALAAARAVSDDAPRAREARYAAALSLIEMRGFDEAWVLLQALHNDEPSPVVLNTLGVIQVRRGSTPQTGLPTDFFSRAVAETPDNVDYLFNLGYAHARSRNAEASLQWLREVVRFDPADGDAHLVMSFMLRLLGRTVEADRELSLARQLSTSVDPDELTDRVPAGLERLNTRLEPRPTDRVVAAVASTAQREQAELAAFHLARGRRYFAQEDDRAAIDELRRAIYLQPYEDEPHVLLGQIYQRTGRLPEALEAFRIGVWVRPSVPALILLADALHESGDTEGALREARRALAAEPESLQVRELLARIGGHDGVHSDGHHG